MTNRVLVSRKMTPIFTNTHAASARPVVERKRPGVPGTLPMMGDTSPIRPSGSPGSSSGIVNAAPVVIFSVAQHPVDVDGAGGVGDGGGDGVFGGVERCMLGAGGDLADEGQADAHGPSAGQLGQAARGEHAVGQGDVEAVFTDGAGELFADEAAQPL